MSRSEGTTGQDFFISYTHADRAWAEWIALAAGAGRLHDAAAGLGLPPGQRLRAPDAAGHHVGAADDRGAVPGLLRVALRGGGVAGRVRQGPDRESRGCWCRCGCSRSSRRGCWPAGCTSTWSTPTSQTARRRLLDGIGRAGCSRPTRAAVPRHAARAGCRRGPRFPGGPEITNLPARNRNFSGRGELLEELHASLQAGGDGAVPPAAAVHGLGGVGKTAAGAGVRPPASPPTTTSSGGSPPSRRPRRSPRWPRWPAGSASRGWPTRPRWWPGCSTSCGGGTAGCWSTTTPSSPTGSAGCCRRVAVGTCW